MKTIHKFELSLTDHQQISGHIDNDRILSVGFDPSGRLCVWAEVDTDAPIKTYDIHIVGTGNPRSASCRFFIGTVLNPPFVWHVYYG